jgi:hypothetical protein
MTATFTSSAPIPSLTPDQYYILNFEWAGLDCNFTYKDVCDNITDWYDQSNVVRFLDSNYNPFYIRNVIVNPVVDSLERNSFDPFEFEKGIIKLGLDYNREFLGFNDKTQQLIMVPDAMIMAYPKFFENWLFFPIDSAPHAAIYHHFKELRDSFGDPIHKFCNFGLVVLMMIVVKSKLDDDECFPGLYDRYASLGLTQTIEKTKQSSYYDLWELKSDILHFYKRNMLQDFILVPLPFTTPKVERTWQNDQNILNLLTRLEIFEDFQELEGIKEALKESMPFTYDFSLLH